MIALGTGTLVAFLVEADAGTEVDRQAGARARAAMGALSESAPGFVSREGMVDLVRALEAIPGPDRAGIAAAIEGLLSAHEVVIERILDGGK